LELCRTSPSPYICGHVFNPPLARYRSRKSRQIMVGSVPVGGDAPVTVQTMTNTPTEDAKATIDQIRRCEEAGGHHPRVLPDVRSDCRAEGDRRAAKRADRADIHFHYKRALEAADAGAACLRINPAISAPRRVGKWSRRQGQRLLRSASASMPAASRRTCSKIWRALPGGAGRERARPYPNPRGP
jgi:hypothetical protein